METEHRSGWLVETLTLKLKKNVKQLIMEDKWIIVNEIYFELSSSKGTTTKSYTRLQYSRKDKYKNSRKKKWKFDLLAALLSTLRLVSL